MRLPVSAGLFVVASILAATALIAHPGQSHANPAGPHVRVLPAIAADSAPGLPSPTPTPTPTPVPGGGSSDGLVVTVIFDIVALELSTGPTGTTPVQILADATIPMAGPLQASAASGSFSIADHPVDAAGCSWPRTDVTTGFSIIVYEVRQGAILLGMTSPQWHYNIVCPGVAPIRIPAFGEESLELFLRDLMTPYYVQGGTAVLLPLQPAAAPGCLKQYGVFSHSGIQAAPALVSIYVHGQGCSP